MKTRRVHATNRTLPAAKKNRPGATKIAAPATKDFPIVGLGASAGGLEALELYSRLFEFAPVGYLMIDADGAIQEANHTATRLLGLNREELLSKKLTAFICPESQDLFYRQRQRAYTNGVKQTCKLAMLRKDSSTFVAEVGTTTARIGRQQRQWLVTFTDRTPLQKTEESLLEASKLNHQIINCAQEGIIVYGCDLKYQVFNPYMEKLTEMPAAKVIGKHPQEVFPFLREAGVINNLTRALAGESVPPLDFPFQIPHTGRIGWAVDTCAPLRNTKGEITGVIGIIHDVTERKQAELRIARLNRVQTILASVDHAIVHIADPQKLLEEICRVAVEEGGFKLAWVGMARPDGTVQPVAKAGAIAYLQGLHVVTYDIPEGHGPVGTAIRENRPVIIAEVNHDPRMAPWLERLQRFGLDYIATFPIQIAGKVAGAFSLYAPRVDFFDENELSLLTQVSEDISHALSAADILDKRKIAEDALHNREKELADFFDSSPIGLLWVESNGIILRVNKIQLELFGCPAEEVLGRPISLYFADPEVVDDLLNRLSKGETVQNWRARIPQKNGDIRHILIDANSLWEKKELIHSRWFVRDITRRVELEHEILGISEREIRRLGHDLHDDLCQQLAGIEFLTQTLATQLTNHAPAKVDQAKEIAQLARNAMNQTREMARGLSPVSMEANGLMVALRELAHRTQNVFRVDCHFKCESSVLVTNNKAVIHLYRIAQEAISNAIKHGKAQCIDIRLTTNGNNVSLGVSDNGIGFPKKMRKKTGMGLRIMQYRASVIGGSLLVHRNPKGGTEVVCTVTDGLHPPPTTKNKKRHESP